MDDPPSASAPAPAPSPARHAPAQPLFAILRHPAFRWIWFASLVSNVGNWMEVVAQAWLVQSQTRSPFFVELLSAAEFIPVVLLTLLAGKLADRHDRRKLLLAGQIGMMIFAAAVALLTHLGLARPWVIISLAFAAGAAWAAVAPAWQALVPALVPRDELPAAIALNSAQFNTARLLGPMLAGALLTARGPALAFDLNTLSFLGIVVVLWRVRIPSRQTLAAAPTSPGAIRAGGGVREALRWALRERGPRRILLGLFFFALFAAPVQGLLPVYADEVLHVGAHGYGLLLSCLGAGAICGALSLARLPRAYPRHHLIPLSMLAFALCAITYAWSRQPVLSGAALAVGGVFWVWSLASSSTAMQLLVPEALRGRGMSVLSLATMGPLPLGHLLGGTLAHAFGPRAATLSTAAGLAVFALWSAIDREPGMDAHLADLPARRRPATLRAAVWEALTAASHRAQAVEPGLPPGSGEPVE